MTAKKTKPISKKSPAPLQMFKQYLLGGLVLVALLVSLGLLLPRSNDTEESLLVDADASTVVTGRPIAITQSVTCQDSVNKAFFKNTSPSSGGVATIANDLNSAFWQPISVGPTLFTIELGMKPVGRSVLDSELLLYQQVRQIVNAPTRNSSFAAVESKNFIKGNFTASAQFNFATTVANNVVNTRGSDSGIMINLYRNNAGQAQLKETIAVGFARRADGALTYRFRRFDGTRIINDPSPIVIPQRDASQLFGKDFIVRKKCDATCQLEITFNPERLQPSASVISDANRTKSFTLAGDLEYALIGFRNYRDFATTANAPLESSWSQFNCN